MNLSIPRYQQTAAGIAAASARRDPEAQQPSRPSLRRKQEAQGRHSGRSDACAAWRAAIGVALPGLAGAVLSLMLVLLPPAARAAESVPESVHETVHEPGHASQSAPQYTIARCCSLCPEARMEINYDDYPGDSGFRYLQDGRDGWLFRSDIDLSTDFSLDDKALVELSRLREALAQQGTRLVLLYLPARGLMAPNHMTPEQRAQYDFPAALAAYRAALQRFRDRSGVVVPPLDRLVEAQPDYDFYFRRDHHWTSEGARRAAALVAETLRALPEYAALPKHEYRVQPATVLGKRGPLQNYAAMICGDTASDQFEEKFSAAAVGGADDLFGDATHPEVALVGTSNTAAGIDRSNFVGFLEQQLQVDILNTAIVGGGLDGSLLKYLNSPDFQQSPPKVLIWETPYYDFVGDHPRIYNLFRSALPALHNGCAGRPVAVARTLTLHAGDNEIFFNGGGALQPWFGDRYLMDLQLSDPGIQEISGKVWYLSGSKEDLHFKYNKYSRLGGRFLIELRHELPRYAQAQLMTFNLQLPAEPAQPLTVKAALCERVDEAESGAASDTAAKGASRATAETGPAAVGGGSRGGHTR